jgi:hypothetical protein
MRTVADWVPPGHFDQAPSLGRIVRLLLRSPLAHRCLPEAITRSHSRRLFDIFSDGEDLQWLAAGGIHNTGVQL